MDHPPQFGGGPAYHVFDCIDGTSNTGAAWFACSQQRLPLPSIAVLACKLHLQRIPDGLDSAGLRPQRLKEVHVAARHRTVCCACWLLDPARSDTFFQSAGM